MHNGKYQLSPSPATARLASHLQYGWRLSQRGNNFLPFGGVTIIRPAGDRYDYVSKVDAIDWYHPSETLYATIDEAKNAGANELVDMMRRFLIAVFGTPPTAPPPPPPQPANDNLDHLEEMLKERGFKVG